MAYDIPPPEKLPEPGYYYHFKHDPDGPLNNYAYYIYGVGHHTEGDCRTEDAFMQVYRPLYEESYAYRNGGLFDLRPLHMFFAPAEWNGKEGAAVHEDRRPGRDCKPAGDQGPHVSGPLAATIIDQSTAGIRSSRSGSSASPMRRATTARTLGRRPAAPGCAKVQCRADNVSSATPWQDADRAGPRAGSSLNRGRPLRPCHGVPAFRGNDDPAAAISGPTHRGETGPNTTRSCR